MEIEHGKCLMWSPSLSPTIEQLYDKNFTYITAISNDIRRTSICEFNLLRSIVIFSEFNRISLNKTFNLNLIHNTSHSC